MLRNSRNETANSFVLKWMVGRFYETLGPLGQLENQVTIFLLVSEVTTIPIRTEGRELRRSEKEFPN